MLNWRVDRGRGLKIPPHPLALFGWAESQAPKATTKRSGDCDTRNLEAKSKRVQSPMLAGGFSRKGTK
jgi:hypothetical protein